MDANYINLVKGNFKQGVVSPTTSGPLITPNLKKSNISKSVVSSNQGAARSVHSHATGFL